MTDVNYQPGDEANGYVLGFDYQWHPVPQPPPPPMPPPPPTPPPPPPPMTQNQPIPAALDGQYQQVNFENQSADSQSSQKSMLQKYGLSREKYIAQVFGRAFSIRVIVVSLISGAVIGVLLGMVWESAGESIVLPAAIALWALYAFNPGSPPSVCSYCRKRVKIGADACHHCGRMVANDSSGG